MLPTFPVLLFGDTCGVMHFKDESELATSSITLLGPIAFDGDRITDVKGVEWKLHHDGTAKRSAFQLVKVLLGRSVETRVSYAYQRTSETSLADLKGKLLTLLANDPGDLMLQFSDEREIQEGLNGAQSVTELFDFVAKAICGKTAP